MIRCGDDRDSPGDDGCADCRGTPDASRGLANSRKSEARLRERPQIVLLAASGLAFRAIARKVGCTPGTPSKWRAKVNIQPTRGVPR
jgi:hypothetical protein